MEVYISTRIYHGYICYDVSIDLGGKKLIFFTTQKSNAEMKKLGKTYYCMVEMDSYLFSLIHKYDWSVSQIHQSFKFVQKTVLRYFGKV